MRKIFLISLCCLFCNAVFAQVLADKAESERKLYSFPLTGDAKGYDFFENALYYHSATDVFNNRNRKMCTVPSVVDFKVSPSASSYVIISANKNKRDVSIYDLSKEDTKIATIKGIKYKPVAACYSSNASELMIVGADSTVYCYNPVTGKPSNSSLRLLDVAKKLNVSGDGRFMTAIHGKNVEFWNMVDRNRRSTLTLAAPVKQVDFSGDCKWLAVLTEDKVITIYDTRTLEPAKTIEGLGEAICCSFHPEGKHIAVVTGDNRISVINQLNVDDREYITSETPAITETRFLKNSGTGDNYLFFDGNHNYSVTLVNYLSPLRSKLINDMLQERMDEWTKQLPGETLEDYALRVNDATRAEQLKAFGLEIATELAMAEMPLFDMQMGNYNTDTQMLTVGLGENMPDIYLNVGADELPSFMETSNLEFRNVKYGLNDKDEYELVYADVYNKATGKTYTYNNIEGQFLEYISDESNSTPLELIQQSMMEEGGLADLKEKVMAEAKDENLITDHTNIQVKTRIVPAVGADGTLYQNYDVGVSYTVDKEFSARDDYASGKYKIEESNAGLAMLKIVKQALEGDFAKYVKPGKRMKVKISGTADASPIHGVIKYDGCYGDFVMQPIYNKGALTNITVKKADGITDNNQLAFMRAVGVKNYFANEIPSIKEMQTEYEYDISVSEQEGSEHRKVSVELTFENAFE